MLRIERTMAMLGIMPISIILGSILTGCAGGASGKMAGPERNRLDVLTTFILALSKRDFRSAGGMLAPTDHARMTDTTGAIQPEFQERLRAMRLTTLMNNPLITVERGKVGGVFDVLPVIEQGEARPLGSFTEPAPTLPAMAGAPPPLKPDGKEELRKAAEAFFRSVRAGKWPQALGLVSKGEREVFLKGNGELKAEARQRLAAIDTSSWQALTLRDGKLTGVVLLIPPTAEAAGE